MKTTKTDFARFCAECKKMQKVLNLLNWSMYYGHKKMASNVAELEVYFHDSIATANLNTDMKDTAFDVAEAGRHEMWHLFFWPIMELAEKKMNEKERVQLRELIHSCISVLEKLNVTEARKC